MTTMTPPDARAFWKALMDNASALIADAHLLLNAGSFGRARSLAVLAQEELGKAIWIYDSFSLSWTTGAEEPLMVDRLAKHGRDHVQKFLEAFVFGDALAPFWGDYESIEGPRDDESWEEVAQRRRSEAEAAAKDANLAKQSGFYVDRDKSGAISSPTEIEAEQIGEDLQVAAQVVEMLLIRDHSRMKLDAQTEYDSTHAQQFRLLPISHPEDWAAASNEFKLGPTGGYPDELGSDAWVGRVLRLVRSSQLAQMRRPATGRCRS
ncbi:MAG: AbiV family abortive infection protein, partial [Kineosporiaceae bacterium]|nr:AbiV family abortive infection protein [Aeromicrobium sp.]